MVRGWCIAILLAGLVVPPGCPAQDWAESAPAAEGLDAAPLARMDAHIQARLPHVRSVLIARHGRLVFEKYYGDVSRDTLQNIQSMTKSISSALVGIALRKKDIRSLDDKVLDYLPAFQGIVTDERVKRITIRHLLTMSSGIDATRGSFDKIMAHPVPDTLRGRLIFDPGAGFKYSDPGAHLLGSVLWKATGMPVLEFARKELFGPLGVERFTWYADNVGLQSGGMSGLCRARDILKLGELYLRKGTWQGREIVPAGFVADSVRVHNSGDFYGETARYGYMWWIAKVAQYDAFYARGYGGQYLMVIPKADLVVLCTSDWRQPEYPEHFALLADFVLPAVVSR
ncbi:MAG TPA: serine hydrolase [Bryobacteraceae bacterium]|nr:serine hydrolase [Bryobacteraceae bacterium]